MAKLNTKTTRTARARTPLQTTAQDAVTFEGAPAWSRDAKTDLFLLAVTNFYGEDTFYEKAQERNTRFAGLVQQVAKEDPKWVVDFLVWLRTKGNIRTAAVVGAVEAARVLQGQVIQPGLPGYAREVMNRVLVRADEPAEALSYWLNTYGKKTPAAIRRGIADAAVRLYTQRNYIKWDRSGDAVRMADVIELTHPDPGTFEQSILFKYILDSRRRPTEIPAELTVLLNRGKLQALTDAEKARLLASDQAPDALQGAGMTWEQVSSWGKLTANVWQAVVPTMGYMALLRNLRNIQEAGVDAKTMKLIQETLASEEAVRKSRQLPFRFLSASKEATSPYWALPLETALQYSLSNIPPLPGRTLVLIDVSGSMHMVMSGKSSVKATTAGALFGIALALKGEAVDVYAYDTNVNRFEVKKGGGVLRETERFDSLYGRSGGGTQTAQALATTFKGHDRVVIITDEQTFGPSRGFWQGNVSDQVPANVPIYSFNMVGYSPAMMETSSTRHQLGGLTDATFNMISMVEAGRQAKWPWLE